MWALELQHVDTVVDAIKDRNGRHAVVDTIIYSLMSLRQNRPPFYYFSAETKHPGEYHYFAFIIGKANVDGFPIGEPFVTIIMMNRFGNRLFMNITEDRTGVLQSVVDGNWDYEEVRSYLCRHLTADPDYTVTGDYNRVSRDAKRLFAFIQDRTTKVLFKKRPGLEKMYPRVKPLPPPIVKERRSLKRKWKRSPTVAETGMPIHISGARVPLRHQTPPRRSPSARPMSPTPPPRYSEVVQRTPPNTLTPASTISQRSISSTGSSRRISKGRTPIRLNALLR
ncbi:MAG: hypothetical protein CBC12_05140 [Candidatus Puniceispirillum sp. TMED52]|nr:MAG: hypothetical protein CBC12_05140 [Candidatus Puniceispirillum sp. TMED52]